MNKIFKFALAALPMVMLASCAKDDLGAEGDIAKETETRYLQVTLSSPTATPVTRAWSDDNTSGTGGTTVVGGNGYYADGTEEENRIRTLEFYFYDADKQFHSYVPMTIPSAPQTPEENPRPTSPNIAAFYHCNVPITLEQGGTLPRYVVCIVNSVEGTVYQGSTMQAAQAKKLSSIYGADHTVEDKTNPDYGKTVNYFGMSNSVYYGNDPVTGASGVLIMAAPFTVDKLLTKEQIATLEQQAEGDGPNKNEIEKFTINIPVERYAAKVNLDVTSLANAENLPNYPAVQSLSTSTQNTPSTVAEGETGGTTANESTTPIALKFVPKKWGVNATEKEFFFLKSFRSPAKMDGNNPEGYSDEFATQANLNTILFEGWNNEAHKRCFWARTPGYYTDNYPLTSDDIKDGGTFDLNYKSWEDCQDVASLESAYAEYVKETTMKQTRLTGEGLPDQYLPTASLPSVILLGQYQLIPADGTTVAEGTDFYLYGETAGKPVVYSGADPIPGTTNIKEQMLKDQTIILTYNEETKVYSSVSTKEVLGDSYASLTVEHPKEPVRKYAASTEAISGGALHITADVVALQFTEAPKTPLYFFNPIAGAYQQIKGGTDDDNNLTYVNLLLYQNLGGAHYYKDGMAYFSAPIQHWGWYRSDNFNVTPVEEKDANGVVTGTHPRAWTEWDWEQMKTGDFGVVRNHVYTMKIGSISGLGHGISDPTDPIVPPADKVSYMVHFHVNIQRWAVLPVQEWNW